MPCSGGSTFAKPASRDFLVSATMSSHWAVGAGILFCFRGDARQTASWVEVLMSLRELLLYSTTSLSFA